MKIIFRIIQVVGTIALIQFPAIAYTDFKEDKKVILFGFPAKAKLKLTYGDLKYFTSIKFTPDKCGTITLKSSRLNRGGLFQNAEDFVLVGDDKTQKTVNVKKSELAAQQSSINWDTIESNQYKYSCLNGVSNPKIQWIEKDGIKFFRYGNVRSPGEKLYISGISYSTVKLKTLQESYVKQVTRSVSSDKCGAVSIRDNKEYPNNLLGNFTLSEKTGPGTWSYNFAAIPQLASRDLIECNRYKR